MTDLSCEARSSLTFPIEVDIGEGITEEDFYLVQDAILAVNNEVGEQVFSISMGSAGKCGIVYLSRGYVPNVQPDTITLGYWWPSFMQIDAGSICSATIHLSKDLTIDRVTMITRHELYHTLGLTHDEVEGSIMNTYPRDGSILLDRDRESVRSLISGSNHTTCNL